MLGRVVFLCLKRISVLALRGADPAVRTAEDLRGLEVRESPAIFQVEGIDGHEVSAKGGACLQGFCTSLLQGLTVLLQQPHFFLDSGRLRRVLLVVLAG